MKISFICGSFVPGKDGVGDYTRRLSAELQRVKHNVLVIALFDKGINKTTFEAQSIDNQNISVLRIPKAFDNNCRYALAAEKIEHFQPDWISLQFVPFSFHPKGLPFKFGSRLKKIIGQANVHIMFHELWVGMEKEAPKKFKLWGYLQKQIILGIIKKLDPKVVHTQTLLYQYQLKKGDIPSTILPLFSNIPVNIEARKTKQDKLVLVTFGSIHPNSPVVSFIEDLLKQYESSKIQLKIIGRSGPEGWHWKEVFEKYGIEVLLIGEQSEESISQELINSSIGISTTPLLLIEKSGTVQSMIGHNLPIVCISKPWSCDINYHLTKGGVSEYKKGKYLNIKGLLKFKDYQASDAGKICKSFLQDLTQN